MSKKIEKLSAGRVLVATVGVNPGASFGCMGRTFHSNKPRTLEVRPYTDDEAELVAAWGPMSGADTRYPHELDVISAEDLTAMRGAAVCRPYPAGRLTVHEVA